MNSNWRRQSLLLRLEEAISTTAYVVSINLSMSFLVVFSENLHQLVINVAFLALAAWHFASFTLLPVTQATTLLLCYGSTLELFVYE